MIGCMLVLIPEGQAMKNGFVGIYRIPNHRLDISKEKARLDKAAATAISILREPVPDTFLGRQHYPLIPLPHETEIKPVRQAAE